MITLTRYLYSKEDVKHSLIHCILKKTDFKECLFWISEYYYSGHFNEIWKLLWKLYYDFYAINNPKLEKFIIKMYDKWTKKTKIVYLLHIIKNYFHIKPNPIVFLIRMAIETQTSQTKSYRGRPPKWLKDMENAMKYKNLLLSIHNKHYKNIAYYLRRFRNEEDELYKVIINYYKKDIIVDKFVHMTIFDSSYKNKLHMLINTMMHLSLNETEIDNRIIHLLINAAELKYAQDTNIVPKRLYHTLPEKRLFKIRTEIGCFNFERNNIREIQLNFWEYYSYPTPIWKERFNKYKIKVDHEKKTIEFEDEMTTCDEYEDFYEKYYYEPDEQSKEVQERSIAEIPDISINEWLNDIFKEENLFLLDNKHKYIY